MVSQLEGVQTVITDPVWPIAAEGMFPECPNPFETLAEVMDLLPASVKRVVIQMNNACDPRFLAAVPLRWPFFHAVWLRYALPSFVGRHLAGREVAYLFGEPPASHPGQKLIPSECTVSAQPVKRKGHPSPRSVIHVDWLVKWWTDAGDTILDPFAGSGTTGIAAAGRDHDCILIDINPDYTRLAAERIRNEWPLMPPEIVEEVA